MAAKRSKTKAKSAVRRKASTSGSARKTRKKTKMTGKAPAKPSTTDTQVEQIQRVIDVMVAAGAVEVELEDKGAKLRIRLKEDKPGLALPVANPVAPMATVLESGAPAADAPAAAPAPAAPAGEVFKSPMVGTFYRSPSPDSEPFAKEGDHVEAESVICIIEAMKVMNEIKAEMEGQIVEVLAQNGEPVDYGQPLFVIKT